MSFAALAVAGSSALTAGAAVAGVGTTLLTGLYQGKSRGEQARRQHRYIEEQLGMLTGAEKQLGEAYGMKTELAQGQFQSQLGQLGYQTGQSLYDITMGGQRTAAGTGMAFSGTAQRQMNMGQERIRRQYGFGVGGLKDVLGEKLMGIEEWYGGQKGQISQERSRLQYELDEAKAEGWGKSDIRRMFGG